MTEHSSTDPVGRKPAGTRLPSLTGMRFLAAGLVFLFHSSRLIPPLTEFQGSVATWYSRIGYEAGWVGVSFFFLLSGFVLTWVASPRDTARRFWRRRAAKIYPNHVVMFVVTIVALSISIPWRQWLPNLLLVQTWFPTPHMDTVFSVDQPSWSLSCEIVFYLCFPVLYRAVQRISPRRLWAWAGGMVVALFAVATFAQFALPNTHLVPVPGGPVFSASEWQVWVVYALPPVRMIEFVLGMLMARIVLSGRWIGLPLLPAGLIALAAYVASYAFPWTYAAVAVCAAPLALLITSAASADARGLRSHFSSPTLVRLGEISFAFYLVHGPVLGYVRARVGFATFAPLPAAGMVLLCFAIAVALATVLHKVVEEPIMRRFGRSPDPARVGRSARPLVTVAGPSDS
jgi:peptidoglycan/LPS O-acetylase OafA/YrhL